VCFKYWLATSFCLYTGWGKIKISQRENRDIYIMQEYFYTEFSTFIYHILCLHKPVQFHSVNLIFGEVAQHQSQCFIFANQQLNLTFSLWSCCFRPAATRLSFRCCTTLINPFTDCFHWAKLPVLYRRFCNSFSVSKTKFQQSLDLSFIFVREFTHNKSYRPNCDYDLKYWRL